MLRARALEQAQARPANVLPENSSNISESLKPVSSDQSTDQTGTDQKNGESIRVKAEIKKILVTMGAIIVVIIIIYFVNQKTDLALQAGKYLTNLLNINL